jgi:hypothetical protein
MREHLRMTPRQPGRANAPIGSALGQFQHTGHIAEHRREPFVAIQTAPLDLGDVCDQLGVDLSVGLGKLSSAAQKLTIGERIENKGAMHELLLPRGFRASCAAPCAAKPRVGFVFESTRSLARDIPTQQRSRNFTAKTRRRRGVHEKSRQADSTERS